MSRSVDAFVLPHDAIQVEAAIDIAAAPRQAAAVYRDVQRWDKTFPATIECAQITRTGDHWMEIEVTHKQEGCVPNRLIDLSGTEIGLEESKRKFDAAFVNRFEPAEGGGTHYVIHGYFRLKGIYRILQPFLAGYVRRLALKQMHSYVLCPLKIAVESQQV